MPPSGRHVGLAPALATMAGAIAQLYAVRTYTTTLDPLFSHGGEIVGWTIGFLLDHLEICFPSDDVRQALSEAHLIEDLSFQSSQASLKISIRHEYCLGSSPLLVRNPRRRREIESTDGGFSIASIELVV